MRCYIKSYIYAVGILGVFDKSLFTRTYQDEHWLFTGRIKYQRDEYGYMRVSFEIVHINEEKEPVTNIWYEDDEFGFDKSTAPLVVDCTTKQEMI